MKQQITILIIRLSSIGDIFHTLTVLPDIKKKFPDSSIDWCVDKSFEKIVKIIYNKVFITLAFIVMILLLNLDIQDNQFHKLI